MTAFVDDVPSAAPALFPALPASWYTDATVLSAERDHVLTAGWTYVGPASAVAERGSWWATTVLDRPVLVTRDEQGTLRALVNVCRHRGALVATGRGCGPHVMCGYHGWTYRLDGSVESSAGTPVPDGTQLPALAVEAWGPLLFVHLGHPLRAVAEVLQPFDEIVRDVARVELETFTLHRHVEHRIAANWKAVIDNFIECYHCGLVHRTTLPGFGRSDYTVRCHDGLQTQQLDRERFAFAYLFPTTQLSVYASGGGLVARHVVPVDAGHTVARLDYRFGRDTDEGEADAWVEFFESVIAEDEPMCESAQRGMATATLTRGYLHPEREKGLLHFHDQVRAQLAGTLVEDAV